MVVGADDLEICPGEIETVGLSEDMESACDRAAELAEKDPDALIAVTVGESRECEGMWVGDLIGDHLAFRKGIPRKRIVVGKASEFTTFGEMQALAKLIKSDSRLSERRNNMRIILAVRWWHAPRARFLCKYHLKKEGLASLYIPVTASPCPSVVPWWVAFIYELFAWIKNLGRVFNRINEGRLPPHR